MAPKKSITNKTIKTKQKTSTKLTLTVFWLNEIKLLLAEKKVAKKNVDLGPFKLNNFWNDVTLQIDSAYDSKQ